MSEENLLQRLEANDPTLTICRLIADDGDDSNASDIIAISRLAKALTNSSFVEAIHLENIPIDDESFLEAIPTVPHLRQLTLIRARLSVATARKLCSSCSASSLRLLETLNLSNNPKLGPRGCKVLAESLLSHNNKSLLQDLNLSNVGMGHYGAQAMMYLPLTLQKLNLSHNGMGHDGLWKLAEQLSKLKDLRELDLSYNKCLDDGCLELAKHVLPELERLVMLNLAGNDIGDTSMQALATSLGDSGVQELYLQDNKITNVGVQALAELALVSQPVQTILDTSDDEDGNESCSDDSDESEEGDSQHSPPSVPSKLCFVDLSSNQIGSSGCTALAKALSKVGVQSCLHTLNLSNNQIGDEGAGSFVEMLDDMTTLVSLDLSGNPFSEARTRILDMLLKHRVAATPRNKTTLRGSGVDDSESYTSETTLYTAVDHHEDTSCSNSEHHELLASSASGNVERGSNINQVHELLQKLKMADNRNAMTMAEIPSNCFDYMTDSFSLQRIASYSTFGPLYFAKVSFLSSDDDKNVHDFVARKMVLGPAGKLQAVRDSVMTEIIHLQHESLLSAVAYSSSQGPTCFCFLYNITDRCSLAQLLRDESQRKKLTWPIRINILKMVAQVLVYLHAGDASHSRKPMFHGDVQPNNIFVAGDFSTAKLVDAGLSRLLATDRVRFADGDVVFGSRGYRCPRYERGSCQYDTASDMFSFGVVIAEVVTGRLQRSKGERGMAWDFFFDVILQRRPLEIDRLPGPIVPKAFLEQAAQIIASCMSQMIEMRPKAAAVADILGKLL